MLNNIASSVKDLSLELFQDITEIRHELHQHPELSFEEKETSGRIKNFLTRHNISFTDGWAGFGVIASIKGNEDGPLKMLRADMDALPIKEMNDIPYRSKNEGIMHACGHDVHSSSLLGAAAIVQKLKNHLKGEVRFVFQPGEEKLPGGASMMISEGLFKNQTPAWIVGQHVYPSLPAGQVGFREGLYMASSDELYITIKGKGGHGATPHLCIDPILVSSKVITALQEIISRRVNPMSSAVLSIGRIYSDGGATNVIPEKVFMEGTLRAMDETWRLTAHEMIRELIESTCKASGATAEINIVKGYPSLTNDPKVTEFCRNAAIEYLGEENVHELPQRMTSEDFAFYTHEIPGTFYRLGTGWKDPARDFPVHSNRFDINDRALETGMGLMSYLTLR